jgi:hypothetical protein
MITTPANRRAQTALFILIFIDDPALRSFRAMDFRQMVGWQAVTPDELADE